MRSLVVMVPLPGPPGRLIDSARTVRPTVVPSYKLFGPAARDGLMGKTHFRNGWLPAAPDRRRGRPAILPRTAPS
ncbi:hypothetical protein San01_65400 [Streptomyces angustmyceticus]|uniref:Uncharacterized protein n=1 Tax=Streptomyces angustmyceticus TaxID=285578 RepID=A0A5J4LPX3_9ACTN|nr:hypothetical protein San01_65400 [Streptomyces angustmyceticus]